VERDPVFLRFAGLQRLPVDRTLVRWMERLPFPALEADRTFKQAIEGLGRVVLSKCRDGGCSKGRAPLCAA